MKKNIISILNGIPLGISSKTIRIMRLTTFLFLISLLKMSASVYSQEVLTIKMENVTLKEMFEEIESVSEFSVFYNDTDLDMTQKVTFNFKDKPINSILSNVLKNSNISYEIKENHIILTEISTKNIKQAKQIHGTVTDKSNSPLPGVSVLIKGKQVGTSTDFDGKYSIKASEEDVLVFSYVGMKTSEVVIGNQEVINIALVEDANTLDEVMVVGYSSKRKGDITGSISSVSGEEINEIRSENFTQAIQGRTAGVYVKSNSGQPGGGVSVRVRGIGGLNNSDPLYIIDGVQMGGASNDDNINPLASINTNDIASIDILKDAASAAIYGARAANGVVIITTKRGKIGAPKFDYSGSFGVQNMSNPNNFRLLNAQEFANVVNQTLTADGSSPIFDGSSSLFPSPNSLGAGTDWLDAVTQDNAPVQEHQISVSGGSDTNKYYLSLNHTSQKGIITNTYYKRYSIRVNTDNKISKAINIGNSLLVSNSINNNTESFREGETGVLNNALTLAPTIPVYNDDGSFSGQPDPFYHPKRNPLAVLTKNINENKTTSIIGNVYGDAKLGKGFSFKTNFSANLIYSSVDKFQPTYSEGTLSKQVSEVGASSTEQTKWIWNNVISYNLNKNNHNLSALIGTEVIESKLNILSGSSTYTDNSIRIVSAQGSETNAVDQYKSGSSLISYFGNVSYNYDNRYYVDGNIRRDGSSKFGANNRWGVFPSVSAAWRVSGEEFFPEGKVDDLKIRASFGKVGNDKVGDFTYIAGIKNVFYGFGDSTGVFTNGLAIDALGNPNLKWETSKQINVGFNISMLDYKLTIGADYFKTDVSDMLIGLPIPALTGISASTDMILLGSVTSNAGSLTNKGFELEASYSDEIGKLTYTIGANLTTFDNEVTDIGQNDQIWGQSIQGENVSRTVVGGSLGEFYGYSVDGIFQNQAEVDAAPTQNVNTAPGDYRYKDLNGDNVIDAKDRGTIGSPIPDFTYGISLGLEYENFNLSMLWAGTEGNEIFNANRIDLEASGRTNFNKSSTVLNSWNGPGTSNTIARRIASDPNQNRRVSSAFVEDGSYLALRNIKIGYSVPKTIISKFNLSNAELYVSGQNLIMLTDYSGFDPEVGNFGGSNLNSGIDNDLYPHASTITLGVNLSF
jgi:TonB-linked SusC/RagA family outer membrane protein